MFLPAGRAVLFTTVTGGRAGVAGNTISDSTTVEAVTLATGERKVLVRDASQPSYVGSGHLLYAVGSTLYAVAFDPERLELRGDAVPVQENVARSSNSAAKYAVSASGALAFVHGGGSTGNVLVWVDREGREEPLGAPPRQYFYPRLSPDGTRIAVDVRAEKQEIWIWDIEREASTRLTGSEGQPTYSVWSPDGRKVFHSTSLPSGDWAIVARNADGSGDPFTVIEEPRFILPSAITADGKGLLATRGFSGAAAPPFDIVLIDPAVKAEPKVLLHRAGSFFTAPALSPDGRFVAYVSDESGTAEVFVRPYPALDSHRWQVSSGGGRMPYWSRDGREIFFVDGREHLAAASVTMRDGTLSIGRAEVLLHTAFLSSFGRSYDVTPDGKRFLMIKGAAAGDEPNGRVVYVQNWLHELRRLAPPRR
jgi:serine/threonine-protein kinase